MQIRSAFALGLVVGKFAPLHLGHEWLIDQAARQCDRLLILSYSKPEFHHCAPAVRQQWLAARFPTHEAIVLDDSWLRRKCAVREIPAHPVPGNDASDDAQQQFLAWLLGSVLQRSPDAMFSSEAYGPSCAMVLGTALGRAVTPVVALSRSTEIPRSYRYVQSKGESPHRALIIIRVPPLARRCGSSSIRHPAAAACWRGLEPPVMESYDMCRR
jgi:HTH-type transcriptional repressor of NAD biosynthesis genes